MRLLSLNIERLLMSEVWVLLECSVGQEGILFAIFSTREKLMQYLGAEWDKVTIADETENDFFVKVEGIENWLGKERQIKYWYNVVRWELDDSD